MAAVLFLGVAAVLFLGAAAGAVAGSRDKVGHGNGHGAAAPQPVAWSGVGQPSRGKPQAIGGYAGGCLAGGAALAGEGTGYQVIRMSRHRYYGHPVLVSFMRDFGAGMAARSLGTALVADMSQPRGGPMRYGHASHQSGLDADVWLRLDLPAVSRKARESLDEVNFVDYARKRPAAAWSDRHVRMVRLAAEDPRVDRIFLNPVLKQDLCRRAGGDRDWLRKVRAWWGHDGHMHVRLSCPPGSPACTPQKPIPPGDGCGDDLAWWLDRIVPLPTIPRDEAKTPDPKLPAQCTAVIRADGRVIAEAETVRLPGGN